MMKRQDVGVLEKVTKHFAFVRSANGKLVRIPLKDIKKVHNYNSDEKIANELAGELISIIASNIVKEK